MIVCSVEGCDRKHKAQGLCKMHYSRLQRGTLFTPPRYPNGKTLVWPYAVRKIDGVWYRRPSDCEPGTPWEIVPGFLGVRV